MMISPEMFVELHKEPSSRARDWPHIRLHVVL